MTRSPWNATVDRCFNTSTGWVVVYRPRDGKPPASLPSTRYTRELQPRTEVRIVAGEIVAVRDRLGLAAD